jgi:acyl-CoA thioester hydrolase
VPTDNEPARPPAPFPGAEGVVRPEWIDANGHMNLAYYVVLFDTCGIDPLFAALGFGEAYREATNHGPFAVETHTLYERELLAGERVRLSAHVLGVDAKRLHVALEMHRAADGKRAAAQEVLFLHVDLGARRAVPFPSALLARLAAAAAAHAALPRPGWVGRKMGLPGG